MAFLFTPRTPQQFLHLFTFAWKSDMSWQRQGSSQAVESQETVDARHVDMVWNLTRSGHLTIPVLYTLDKDMLEGMIHAGVHLDHIHDILSEAVSMRDVSPEYIALACKTTDMLVPREVTPVSSDCSVVVPVASTSVET